MCTEIEALIVSDDMCVTSGKESEALFLLAAAARKSPEGF